MAALLGVEAAENFFLRGLADDIIVHDAVPGHIHAHVRGGLVGGGAGNALEHGLQHGENFHVPVVVDGGHAVGLQVEGVDHVHVIEVCGGGLVGQVHRVTEGKVPDGEGLILGVPGLDAPLVLMVELAQAHGHLAAAGAGGGDDHQGAAGLDVFVLTVALFTDDQRNVIRIALDGVVAIDLQAQAFQLGLENFCRRLAAEAGQHDAVYLEPEPPEYVDETQGVGAVGDTQVAPDLAFFQVHGGHGHHDLYLILQLHQHPNFRVWVEPRQDPGGVVVVKQFAAKLQVELTAELVDAGADVLRLHFQIFFIVETKAIDHLVALPLFSLAQPLGWKISVSYGN